MKKKYITAAITVFLLAGAGMLYSCAGTNASSIGSSNSLSVVDSLREDKLQSENEKSEGGKAHAAYQNLAGEQNAESSPDGIKSRDNSIKDDTNSQDVKETGSDNKYIYVHICGAVIKPGVYKISPDLRLVDIISLAGGLTEDAAGDSINQAKELRDGERIYVPTEEEIKESGTGQYISDVMPDSTDSEANAGSVDINSAGLEELMSLPGIGKAKAESIIRYRSEHGGFRSVEDIMNISGIKEGLFKQLSPYITVK